jgi:uridine phosphorylase
MAVLALEVLIGGGAEEVLYLGTAGSLVPTLSPGDLFFPSLAFSSEGTSAHYQPGEPKPDEKLYANLKDAFSPQGRFNTGPVWTTDAPLRETQGIRDFFKEKGALAVEMEVAALFAAASFRKIKLAAMLLTSDTFGEGKWRSGSRDKKFKQAASEIGELSWRIFK